MPVARFKFSGDAYDQLTDTDLFADRRVELIDGDIVEMSPLKDAHIVAVRRLTRWFTQAIDTARDVQVQLPLALGESRPEPDLALVPRASKRATSASLIVEVADSSLQFDTTTKERLYAEAGVPEYWVVNISDREIWVYTEPRSAGYAASRRYRSGDVLPVERAPCAIEVHALFEEI